MSYIVQANILAQAIKLMGKADYAIGKGEHGEQVVAFWPNGDKTNNEAKWVVVVSGGDWLEDVIVDVKWGYQWPPTVHEKWYLAALILLEKVQIPENRPAFDAAVKTHAENDIDWSAWI